MSVKSIETIAPNQQKMTFEVDHDTFEAAVAKAYKKSSKNITIPGFRKGKAPRALIEKMYGRDVFYEDAVNDIIPDAYADAMKEYDKTVVSRPSFELESVDENGVVITATFYTKPDPEISDYLGIPVTRTLNPVTDEEVDAEISRVQNRNARMIEVTDRPAKEGDLCNIDFDGSVDGVPFEGGQAEGHELKLGSGQFIPGFEEQIVGHSIGDDFDVSVTFPEDYHEESLKGKAAVFKCKLNGIKYTELPALDDEFACDVSEFNTFDEYKADVRAKITAQHEKQADNDVDEQIMTALNEKLVCEIPEVMFENETENFVRDFDNRLRMQGLDLSTYLKYTGMDLKALRKRMRPDAERQVKTRLALEKIAELEAIEVSDEEIEGEYDKLAAAYNMEGDRVRKLVEKPAITEDIKVRKAVDLLKEKAVVTEVTAEPTSSAETPAETPAETSDEAKAE